MYAQHRRNEEFVFSQIRHARFASPLLQAVASLSSWLGFIMRLGKLKMSTRAAAATAAGINVYIKSTR